MKKNLIRFAFTAGFSLILSGCLLPEAPKKSSFSSVTETSQYTLYTMDRDHNAAPARTNGKTPTKMLPTTKNLIFVTADQITNRAFQPLLEQAYKKDPAPTLNEVSWWQLVPVFRDLYNKVIYIPADKAKNANIMAAIQYMEKQSLRYDLIILSHGYPNFLTSGDPGYFLSFTEIDAMKGQLKKLNLVFMQACYGDSLAKDWLDAGARTVIAFEGEMRNFFFISVFLDHHRWYDERGAFFTANRDMAQILDKKKLYKLMIERGLKMDIDQYLDQAEEPKLKTR